MFFQIHLDLYFCIQPIDIKMTRWKANTKAADVSCIFAYSGDLVHIFLLNRLTLHTSSV